MPLDAKLFLAVLGTDPDSALTLVMRILTWIGNGWTVVGLVPLFFFPHTRRFATSLGIAFLTQLTLVWAVKRIVRRVRPYITLDAHPLGALPTDFSFPSGHASGCFTFALFVVAVCIARPSLRGRWFFAVGALVIAIGICYSRVYLGAHYPGDVLGGAVLGGVIGFTGGRWYSRPSRTTL